MKDRKHQRCDKRQMGQFMTPRPLASKVIGGDIKYGQTVLEPSFGDGSFIIELAKQMMPLYNDDINAVFDHIYGTELDPVLFEKCLSTIHTEFKSFPVRTHLFNQDYLLHDFGNISFDREFGNPPFGGTIDLTHQKELEEKYGLRYEETIKRETYSYFLVKSVDLLAPEGRMSFICSDTFLTIKTMAGLRKFLMEEGTVSIEKVSDFSEETSYGMVIINFIKSTLPRKRSECVTIFGKQIYRSDIEKTGNFSWGDINEYIKYFGGACLSDYIVCSSGMTVGKNEYFVREIVNGQVEEPYEFCFYDKPITLKDELKRAHLNHLSDTKQAEISKQEEDGKTREDIKVEPLTTPKSVLLPNDDYVFYNKMVSGEIYVDPRFVIYWKDDGKAVKTFKKNGNWYLHGFGGMPFFKREGFTWNLIGSRIGPRYLPNGYILDSGCPCGFLKDGTDPDELFFIMGWLLTSTATSILKKVMNHTRNIQGKDVERLPYPLWVDKSSKEQVIRYVKSLIKKKQNNLPVDEDYIAKLTEWFKMD